MSGETQLRKKERREHPEDRDPWGLRPGREGMKGRVEGKSYIPSTVPSGGPARLTLPAKERNGSPNKYVLFSSRVDLAYPLTEYKVPYSVGPAVVNCVISGKKTHRYKGESITSVAQTQVWEQKVEGFTSGSRSPSFLQC